MQGINLENKKGFIRKFGAKFPYLKKNSLHIFPGPCLIGLLIPHCLNITPLDQGQACYAILLLSYLDIKPVIVDCSTVGSLENEISFK